LDRINRIVFAFPPLSGEKKKDVLAQSRRDAEGVLVKKTKNISDRINRIGRICLLPLAVSGRNCPNAPMKLKTKIISRGRQSPAENSMFYSGVADLSFLALPERQEGKHKNPVNPVILSKRPLEAFISPQSRTC
jgi:hypothetical protein